MAERIALRDEDIGELSVRTADITALAERREALLVEAERLYRLHRYTQEALTSWLIDSYSLDKDTRWHIDLQTRTIVSLL